MAKELFNRYVWLIDTLQRYGRLTRREIDGCGNGANIRTASRWLDGRL